MSLISAASQKINLWNDQLRDSSVGRFWSWWMTELRSLLPAKWRARLVAEARPLQILPETDSYQLHTDSSHKLSLLKGMDPEIAQQQIQQLLLDAELQNPEKVLFLPVNDVLQTDVSLPLAAEGRLRQALEFDLDRQTPFRSSDVYFDFSVNSRDKVHNLIHLKLYLVPRQLADQHVLNLHQMGININRLSTNDELEDSTQRINLLPLEMRAQRVNYKARFNRLLGLVLLVLLVIAMLQAVRVREQYIDELNGAIASVSKEARMVANMRQQIEDAREGASFLAKRETEFPEDIEVIAELTNILANDTYLQRLIIKDGEIRVQGLSSESQRLIRDINASEYFAEAAFLGTTQFDSRAQKERFNVSAKLLKIADRVALEENIGDVESSATQSESEVKEATNAATSN